VLGIYLIKRLGMALAVCGLVVVFLVVVVYVVPGDTARALATEDRSSPPTPEFVEQVRRELKLDQPVHVQVWDFFSGAVQGDLGRDFASRTPVSHIIAQSLPDTLILALSGMILAILVGVPLGVLVARYPNTFFDRAMGGVSMLLVSGLPYVVALLLLLLFAVQLQWLPASGAGDISDPIDYLRHLILPAIALAIPWWGYLPRFVRASMLEVMSSPYIRTSRALGYRERAIFYKYALKNALVPVVALFGLMLGYAVAGTVYAEVIFSRPGLGSLAVEALTSNNWPVVRAIVLLFALFFVLGNLLSDFSYRLLDPRIRVEEGIETPA